VAIYVCACVRVYIYRCRPTVIYICVICIHQVRVRNRSLVKLGFREKGVTGYRVRVNPETKTYMNLPVSVHGCRRKDKVPRQRPSMCVYAAISGCARVWVCVCVSNKEMYM